MENIFLPVNPNDPKVRRDLGLQAIVPYKSADDDRLKEKGFFFLSTLKGDIVNSITVKGDKDENGNTIKGSYRT